MSSRAESTRERGMSESLSWTLLIPVILICVLGFIQGALWVNGRTVVTNAALAGAEAQALAGSTPGEAERVANAVAMSGGLSEVSVSTSRSAGMLTVFVSGRVQSFFGSDIFRVQARASRPLEVS